jgi:hypothetical protein
MNQHNVSDLPWKDGQLQSIGAGRTLIIWTRSPWEQASPQRLEPAAGAFDGWIWRVSNLLYFRPISHMTHV